MTGNPNHQGGVSKINTIPSTPFGSSLINTDLEALMNFQQFFVPSASKAGGINEDFATQSTTSSAAGEPLEAFMYNMGTNDILFDGNI